MEIPHLDGIPLAWRTLENVSRFGLYVLADPDAPLEEAATAPEDGEDRTPYFATLWPAGASLAALLLAGPRLDGRRVLDLGCGAGPSGLAAALQGADVTFLDWEPRALRLVEHSAARLGVEPAGLIQADWREDVEGGPWEIVVGADVLYEERNAAGVARFLAAHLADRGRGLIADPGRAYASGLEPALADEGLRLRATSLLPERPHGVEVTLYSVSR